MKRALQVIGRGFQNYWSEVFNLTICNFLWLFAQLLIITGPPATMAMFAVANRATRGSVAQVGEFIRGIKQYFVVGWKLGALNLLVIAVLGYGAFFYLTVELPGGIGPSLAILDIGLLAIWLMTQIFAYPFWLEQEDRRVLLALRNSLVFQLQNLWITLFMVLVVVMLAWLSWKIPPLVGLVSVAFLAVMGNTVVLAHIEQLRKAAGE